MIRNHSLCDVIFKFKNNEEIGANISLLSANSPVFKAMFQPGFVECKTKTVKIEDIDIQVFKEMLDSIHSGKAPSRTEINFIKSLYASDDNYFVETLKTDCISILVRQLSLENALDLLIWAEFQSVPELFTISMNLIVQNCKEFCFRPELLEFLSNHPKTSWPIQQKIDNFMFAAHGNGSASDSD